MHFLLHVTGPTSSEVARIKAPNSIRAQFGEDTTSNACHGSDSHESARLVKHLHSYMLTLLTCCKFVIQMNVCIWSSCFNSIKLKLSVCGCPLNPFTRVPVSECQFHNPFIFCSIKDVVLDGFTGKKKEKPILGFCVGGIIMTIQ